jgi:predicted transglutaminase-like cysteine proteinase
MRPIYKMLAAVLAFAAVCVTCEVQAAFFGLPRGLKPHAERIGFATPSLAPIAHTRFCLQYPQECEVRAAAEDSGDSRDIELTEDRWAELASVNRYVNRAITPERNYAGVWGDVWLLSPKSGDCNDYAVTKRHELLELGWPSDSLLLAEVVVPGGEHHLVLVVHTLDGDFVLDNLSPYIRGWTKTPYKWVRIQSPKDPKFWSMAESAHGVTIASRARPFGAQSDH